jgi:hypothetical protein
MEQAIKIGTQFEGLHVKRPLARGRERHELWIPRGIHVREPLDELVGRLDPVDATDPLAYDGIGEVEGEVPETL